MLDDNIEYIGYPVESNHFTKTLSRICKDIEMKEALKNINIGIAIALANFATSVKLLK
jgi:hypothetical protein